MNAANQSRAEWLAEINRQFEIRHLVEQGVRAEIQRIARDRGLPQLDWIVRRGEYGVEVTGIVDLPEQQVRGVVEQYATVLNQARLKDERPSHVREGGIYVDGTCEVFASFPGLSIAVYGVIDRAKAGQPRTGGGEAS